MSGVCMEECVRSIFLLIALYVVLKVDAIKMMIMMQSVASPFPFLPLSLVRVTIEKWGGREKKWRWWNPSRKKHVKRFSVKWSSTKLSSISCAVPPKLSIRIFFQFITNALHCKFLWSADNSSDIRQSQTNPFCRQSFYFYVSRRTSRSFMTTVAQHSVFHRKLHFKNHKSRIKLSAVSLNSHLEYFNLWFPTNVVNIARLVKLNRIASQKPLRRVNWNLCPRTATQHEKALKSTPKWHDSLLLSLPRTQ